MASGSEVCTTARAKAPRTSARRGPHRAGQVVVRTGGQPGLDQAGQDLGVGLRLEVVAVGDEAVGELDVVLDDPVVHQGQLAVAVRVGVGVGLRRSAVRGPPGVADAGRGGRRSALGPLGQVVERAGAVGGPDVPQVVGGGRAHQGQSGGVVAPVLQALQTLDQDVEHLVLSAVLLDLLVMPMMPHMDDHATRRGLVP